MTTKKDLLKMHRIDRCTARKLLHIHQYPELHCQSCNRKIPYDEKYVKDNLLYVASNWKKCLCAKCTADWKRRKEIMEVHPNFGKGVDYKMVVIDELKEL